MNSTHFFPKYVEKYIDPSSDDSIYQKISYQIFLIGPSEKSNPINTWNNQFHWIFMVYMPGFFSPLYIHDIWFLYSFWKFFQNQNFLNSSFIRKILKIRKPNIQISNINIVMFFKLTMVISTSLDDFKSSIYLFYENEIGESMWHHEGS